MKNLNKVTVDKIIVHDGVFHADDVLCCAMARVINPCVVIERSNNPTPEDVASDGSNGIWVADVGLGRFDHHQADVKLHTDGTKYAACGLLYEVWKPTLTAGASEESIRDFEDLMLFIENADNGGMMATSNSIINSFRPCWDDAFPMGCGFEMAVDFMRKVVTGCLYPVAMSQSDKNTLCRTASLIAHGNGCDPDIDWSGDVLLRGYVMGRRGYVDVIELTHQLVDINTQMIRAEQAQLRADIYLKGHLGDHVNDTVVFLEQCLPWMRTLIPSKALYVSYPAIRGGWNIQCVPVAVGDRTTKKPFPAEWLSSTESRPAGCTFVHPAGFLAAFATREDAEAAAKLLTALAQG